MCRIEEIYDEAKSDPIIPWAITLFMQNFNISALQMAFILLTFIDPLLFQILKTYIMKLALFLCALVFSLHGWCTSVNPSHPTARTITPGHETFENGKLQEETDSPLPLDKMKAAMIGWGLLTYLAIIFWWAITAKNSLDKILKNVLQEIARYAE